MGRDRCGLWGPLAPTASPPWPEPGQFLARPEMALPDVPLARSAQGRAFAALVIVTPFVCPSWGPLTSSRGRGDAQPFPPCPLRMPGRQLGAPSLFTLYWGACQDGLCGARQGSGDGRAPGWRREDHAWGRGLGSTASCLQSSPCAPSPVRLCPWRRAERAHGGGEAGIARGWCGRPSFLLQTCAKACWGRRRGEEALAGFWLWAQQPGSAEVAMPRVGPWAGHPIAIQGSHLKTGFRGRSPASSRGQHVSPSERGDRVGAEPAARPRALQWLSAPGLISACTPSPPLPASLGTYHQQKRVCFELGPLLRLQEEIERGLPCPWLQMGAPAPLPGLEQPGLGSPLCRPGPKTPEDIQLKSWVPLLCHPQAPQPAVPRQRCLSPALYIWDPDTLPQPGK